MKTNVRFFNKPKDQTENYTQQVWVYDLRTNMPSFGKRTPFTEQHLTPFETAYHANPRTEGEFCMEPQYLRAWARCAQFLC